MSRAVLRVDRAGPHVSIQDRGRGGLMRFGVPASGPMDRFSFAAALAAIGAPADAAAVEISVAGLRLTCLEGALSLAVCGGAFQLDHAGQRRAAWCVLTLRAGETLDIQPGPWGSWTYLAFAGHLQAGSWLGSHSTYALSGAGGGRLKPGDLLILEETAHLPQREGDFPCPVPARARRLCHVVIGPQERFFSPRALDSLLGEAFGLSDAYDRMGVRLRGPLLHPQGALSIPSEPITRGSIQVSGDGVATVLLADHQTTGGYPKIATMVGDDVDGFVQNRARALVGFVRLDAEQAQQRARLLAARRKTYLDWLARGR